jgi:hypothetical protein
MAKRKRDDELDALLAENARLKALLGQHETERQERLPQPVPAEAEMAEAPAPEAPKRPKKSRKKQKHKGSWFSAYELFGLGVLAYFGLVILWTTIASRINAASAWHWIIPCLLLLLLIVGIARTLRADARKPRAPSQPEQRRQPKQRVKDATSDASRPQRERPPRERPRRRITGKLRAPTTQKLEPDDAPEGI